MAGISGVPGADEPVLLCGDDSIKDILKKDLSNWMGSGVNNVFDMLHLNKRYIDVSLDEFFTEFLSEREGFVCQPVQKQDLEDLNAYWRVLDKCMDFDLMDAVLKVHNVIHQYGGYNPALPDSKTPGEVKAVLSEFEKCFLNVEEMAKGKDIMWGVERLSLPGHLIKYLSYAMDFIREAANIVMYPTKWQDRAFVDLFRVFCRLSGMELQHASRESARHFDILGEHISGKPDLRAYVPLDNENWWRQGPFPPSCYVPVNQRLCAVVKVKQSPSSEFGSSEQETDGFLGQVVGEMLAELLAEEGLPLVNLGRTYMLGILVVSTKVYFVKLHVPHSLRVWYRRSGSCSGCQNRQVEEGTLYVTQGFDFMKRETRRQVLKMLHRMGTLTHY